MRIEIVGCHGGGGGWEQWLLGGGRSRGLRLSADIALAGLAILLAAVVLVQLSLVLNNLLTANRKQLETMKSSELF